MYVTALPDTSVVRPVTTRDTKVCPAPQGQSARGFGGTALAGLYCCLALPAAAQDDSATLETLVSTQIADVFSTSAVLTDSEVITLGVLDFNPNQFAPLEIGNLGSDESLDLRHRLQIYALPYSWQPDSKEQSEQRWQPVLTVRASYISISEEVQLSTGETVAADSNRDYVYGLYGEFALKHPLNDRVTLQAGLGSHWMHYKNRYAYNNPEWRPVLTLLDNIILNTRTSAWLAEPNVQLFYEGPELLGNPWVYRSGYHYLYGQTFNEGHPYQRSHPESWRWVNSFTYHLHLPTVLSQRTQLRLVARRIDLGGDLPRNFRTDHYHEVGVGWLMETGNADSWLRNVGIGLSVTIDSVLSGGSVVLLYNEELR